jgi:hypothetical protein
MVTLCSFLFVSIDYVFKQNFFSYLYFLSVGILTVLGKISVYVLLMSLVMLLLVWQVNRYKYLLWLTVINVSVLIAFRLSAWLISIFWLFWATNCTFLCAGEHQQFGRHILTYRWRRQVTTHHSTEYRKPEDHSVHETWKGIHTFHFSVLDRNVFNRWRPFKKVEPRYTNKYIYT